MPKRNATKATSLNLKGQLTVKNANTLRQELLKALDGGTEVTLLLDEVDEVDLTSLQLLCSAHRYAQEKGKTLNLNDPEGILLSAGRAAGFMSGEKCRFAKKNECFWKEG